MKIFDYAIKCVLTDYCVSRTYFPLNKGDPHFSVSCKYPNTCHRVDLDLGHKTKSRLSTDARKTQSLAVCAQLTRHFLLCSN